MVHAIGVHEFDRADQLQHEVSHMFSFQGTPADPDGLVKITVGTVLQNQVNMGIGFEGVDEVDQVGVVAKTAMALQLFEAIIDRQRARSTSGRRLGQTFDGNILTGLEVGGDEDHSKGALIQRSYGSKATIQNLPLDKVALQALHVDNITQTVTNLTGQKEKRCVGRKSIYKRSRRNKRPVTQSNGRKQKVIKNKQPG